MVKSDKPKFAELLAVMSGAFSREVTVPMASTYWALLEKYDLRDVERGVLSYMQTGKFFPSPAEIIEHIGNGLPAHCRHPDSEEAWAIAVRAMDEADTVFRTPQIIEAWNVAQSVMALGDEVGARMAFRSSYERLVSLARSQGIPPKWEISLGTNAELRAMRTEEAARLGMISSDVAQMYALPAPIDHKAIMSGMEKQLRIAANEGQIVDQISKAIAHLSDIKATLERNNESIDAAAQQRELARLEAESKRAEQLQRLNSHAEKSTRKVVK